jgi:hypothetical protein
VAPASVLAALVRETEVRNGEMRLGQWVGLGRVQFGSEERAKVLP